MRVLIVTHEFPPRANPRAFRWGALVEHWSRSGWQVDVVCGPEGRADALPQRGAGLRVFAVGASLLYGVRRRLARGSAPRPAAPAATAGYQAQSASLGHAEATGRRLRHLARAALSWIYDRTWAQLRWPDYAWYWRAAAVRQASALLRTVRYDALVTVSNPFTGHCVGLELKRRFPHVRWLADLGDPLSFGDTAPANNGWLYARRNRRLERAVLAQADAVSMVTQSLIDAYVQRLGVDGDRMHVVPPLLSVPAQLPLKPPQAAPQAVAQAAPHSAPHPAPHRALVYAGMLYRQLRNPRGLLQVFRRLLDEARLTDLQLHFYGNVADCRREFAPYADLLGRHVMMHGPVSRDVVWCALRRCHAVVHLGEPIDYSFPSKLLEYVHLQRPILSLQVRARDRAQAFLSDYGAALCVTYSELETDPARFADLVRFLQCPPRPDPHQVRRLLAPHRLEAVAAAYEALIADRGTTVQRRAG